MRVVAKILIVPLLLLLAIGLQPVPDSSPRSIAGLGDSITRAFACCHSGEQPAQSWSTGASRAEGVRSHYQRLLALNPGIAGNNSNNARSGAKVADLPRQADAAVAQKAEYITVLIGANDLCTSSASTMTGTAEFQASVGSALATLQQGLPRSRVFVSSIPDLYQLWSALRQYEPASQHWATANTCQSMLNESNTEADRQLVVQREIAFNEILANACSRFANCRWDGGAVYGHKFSANEVSTVDYFHPSLRGQELLAELTWKASFWARQPQPAVVP